jgi:uncharacterized protein YxjI
MIDIGGRYDITDPSGTRIGVLEKVFGKSLLRSTWRILDAEEQEVAGAQERSMPMAILRRAIDFVPDFGGLIPIPYNFDIHVNGDVVGRMDRKFQLRDRYVLDLAGDTEKRIDRRLAIALAIGLDTLQNR